MRGSHPPHDRQSRRRGRRFIGVRRIFLRLRAGRRLRGRGEPFRVSARQRGEDPCRRPRESSDTELIARIRAGDQLALQALYARHNVKVFRFALRLLRSEPSAEDVVSEVFTDVWRSPANFEGRSEASTWVLAIARNKAYSHAPAQAASRSSTRTLRPRPQTRATIRRSFSRRRTRARSARLHRAPQRRAPRSDRPRLLSRQVDRGDRRDRRRARGNRQDARLLRAQKLSELAKAAGIDRGWP